MSLPQLQPRTLVEQITPKIEELLIQSAASEGKMLSERALSELLQVSRPILREALRSLQQRGIIEIRPGKGIFPVENIDGPAVRALQDYMRRKDLGFPALLEGRLFLETHIAEVAAERRSDTDVTTLEGILGRMNAALSDAASFEQADLDFHLSLAAATGNVLYSIWLQPIIGMLEGRRNKVVALGEVRTRALAAHRAIFDAVRTQNASAARTAMQQHLQDFDTDTKRAIRLGLLPPS